MKQQTKASVHRPVMLDQVIELLKPQVGGRYLDATLGGAGHSLELLKSSAPEGQVLSLDVDPKALARAKSRQPEYGSRWKIAEANFRHLRAEAEKSGWLPFDGILFDLGISSDELEDPDKGLSFQVDGPLDMRLGPKANDDGLTAGTIVNYWSQSELVKLLKIWGEERYATAIASAIFLRRKSKPFTSTLDLAGVIASVVPKSSGMRIHPATKSFQALRIAVNDELASLRLGLTQAYECLAPNGTLVVISFHSLEDRIVKQIFKALPQADITKKPWVPKAEEIKINPRARSAKLRAATKKATPNTKLCPTPMLLL